ncbi:MAG: hypothetical protein IPK58_21595 [Acidobacteria bacterium]|nr:hypothetical protein [Acidobacteriota bacterium]
MISLRGTGPLGQYVFNIENRPVTQIGGAGYLRINGKITQTEDDCGNEWNAFHYFRHSLWLTFVAPDGTEHRFADTVNFGVERNLCEVPTGLNYGRIFKSVDGTFATFESDSDIMGFDDHGIEGFGATGHLYLADGTSMRVNNGRVLWRKDRNGNVTTYEYDPSRGFPHNPPRPVKIIDSLNREIIIEYEVAEPAPYGLCHRIVFAGVGGETRYIRISLGMVVRPPVSGTDDEVALTSLITTDPTASPQVTGTIQSDYGVKAVWLPDGRKYDFTYNVNGRLAKVVLPTGAFFEHDFAPRSLPRPKNGTI